MLDGEFGPSKPPFKIGTADMSNVRRAFSNTATSAGLAARRDPEGCSRHAKNISCRSYRQNQSGDYHPSGDGADKGSDVTGGRVAVQTAARLFV
jgi:hypothetical protein